MQLVDAELLESRKRSDPLQALSKFYAYRATGKHVHERKKSSTTSYEAMFGSTRWVNILYAWFPAAWMPLVVEALRARTVMGIRHTMQLKDSSNLTIWKFVRGRPDKNHKVCNL